MQTLSEQALIRRAETCLKRGNLMEAKAICEQLIARDKKNAEALHLLGEIVYFQGDFEQGISLVKKCISLHPRAFRFQLQLASWYAVLGRYSEAINAYRKILSQQAGLAPAIVGLADALEHQGNLDDARALIEPIIRSGADDAEIARVYAMLELRAKRPQSAIAILHKHLNHEAPRPTLYFTLGKAYEQAGDYESAFHAYKSANDASPQRFDGPLYRDMIARLIRTFSKENLKRLPRAAVSSSVPTFVTGRPRSGTTLVEKIIAAHPAAHGAGELPYFVQLSNRLNLEIGSLRVYPECALDLDQVDMDRLGNGYLDFIERFSKTASRVVDKSLTNFFHLGLVNLLLPNSSSTICLRDPVDNCLSCYMEDMGLHFSFATQLKNLGITHELCMLLKDHWVRTLDLRLSLVNYEDVVADQEGMSRKIIDFCGLPWDDKCLKFYEVKSESKSSSAAPTLSYDQVRKPIYKTSVGRAQHFAKHLGPLYEGFEEGKRICDEIRAELKLPG